MDLTNEDNCKRAVQGATEVYNWQRTWAGWAHRTVPNHVPAQHPHQHAPDRGGVSRRRGAVFLFVLRLRLQHEAAEDPHCRALKETDAYPAFAERGYGWEKLVSEMFCQEYTAERGMRTAIARLSQCLRAVGHVGWWPREGAGGDVPQSH